jgi:hypothetical protein
VPNVAESNLVDLITGNEVESDGGSGTTTRYVVELSQDFDSATPKKLEILVAVPPSVDVFKPSGFVDPLNAVAELLPTGAALTGDHEILVYSARLYGSTESHLFATAFSIMKGEFSVGAAIGDLYRPGYSDDQPWINADCSQIWFRRDNLTWTAQKL